MALSASVDRTIQADASLCPSSRNENPTYGIKIVLFRSSFPEVRVLQVPGSQIRLAVLSS